MGRGWTRNDVIIEGYPQVVLHSNSTRIILWIIRLHGYYHILRPVNCLGEVGLRGERCLVSCVQSIRDWATESCCIAVLAAIRCCCRWFERGQSLLGIICRMDIIDDWGYGLAGNCGNYSARIHNIKPNLFLANLDHFVSACQYDTISHEERTRVHMIKLDSELVCDERRICCRYGRSARVIVHNRVCLRATWNSHLTVTQRAHAILLLLPSLELVGGQHCRRGGESSRDCSRATRINQFNREIVFKWRWSCSVNYPYSSKNFVIWHLIVGCKVACLNLELFCTRIPTGYVWIWRAGLIYPWKTDRVLYLKEDLNGTSRYRWSNTGRVLSYRCANIVHNCSQIGGTWRKRICGTTIIDDHFERVCDYWWRSWVRSRITNLNPTLVSERWFCWMGSIIGSCRIHYIQNDRWLWKRVAWSPGVPNSIRD